MNGGQDLGGMQGFGAINPEPNEPAFHADWERTAFALTIGMGFHGRWNIDMSRWYRENCPPSEYLTSSYYEIWFNALEKLVADRRLLEDTGRLKAPDPKQALALLAKGTSAAVDAKLAARFKVGDAVRVQNRHPRTHTRMPRYCRGKQGVIYADHGVMVFPDTHAMDLGQKPQHCYSVRFSAAELWGRPGPDHVHLDLWEDYLDAA
ncbi:MAG: nitrile hydratase subunit beta [Betaproteobacteria bacterium]|nr:nitrile hydratase subunit beta [Betaproteobacteria bacterium]